MFRWDSVLGGMVWEGGLKERSWLLSTRLQAGLADPWTLGVHGGVGGDGGWRGAPGEMPGKEGAPFPSGLGFHPVSSPRVDTTGETFPVNWGPPSLPFLDTLRTQLACRGSRRASLG